MRIKKTETGVIHENKCFKACLKMVTEGAFLIMMGKEFHCLGPLDKDLFQRDFKPVGIDRRKLLSEDRIHTLPG